MIFSEQIQVNNAIDEVCDFLDRTDHDSARKFAETYTLTYLESDSTSNSVENPTEDRSLTESAQSEIAKIAASLQFSAEKSENESESSLNQVGIKDGDSNSLENSLSLAEIIQDTELVWFSTEDFISDFNSMTLLGGK